jgi:hypothetical protein
MTPARPVERVRGWQRSVAAGAVAGGVFRAPILGALESLTAALLVGAARALCVCAVQIGFLVGLASARLCSPGGSQRLLQA